MKDVIRAASGLAEPYQVLATIFEERGEARKAMDTLSLYAALTSGEEASRSEEERQSMAELAKLHLQLGRVDEAIVVLYRLFELSGDEAVACEVARLLRLCKRWRECHELLEACVVRGWRERPPRIDLKAAMQFCDLLLETREFRKCACVLVRLLGLRSAGAPDLHGERAPDSFLDAEGFDEAHLRAQLSKTYPDLVAKLAAAACHMQAAEGEGADLLCRCSIDVVTAHPAESHFDLHLCVVDALLADKSAGDTAGGDSEEWRAHRWPRRSAVSRQAALRALAVLDGLEAASGGEDLRERRAACLWLTGRPREAAELLEEALAECGEERAEWEVHQLRVHAAEAWVEVGEPEKADRCLRSLSYDDLQRSSEVPPAMSSEQRSQLYQELVKFIDHADEVASAGGVVDPDGLQRFSRNFKRLVHDCELDQKRLSVHTARTGTVDDESPDSTAAAGPAAAATAAAVAPDAAAPTGAAAEGPAAAAAAPPTPAGAPGALALQPGPQEEGALVPAAEETGVLRVAKAACRRRRLEPGPGLPSAMISKFRRRSLGLETIEDLFGFEAYFSLLLKGVELLKTHAPNRGTACHRRLAELAHCVELCEMVLTNKRLVALRNPMKRKLLRELAMTSVSLAFEARLWRVVFKHLRGFCDQSNNQDDIIGLVARILFNHADVRAPSGPRADARNERTAWERQPKNQVASRWGKRGTYASSVTDVRSWALRQLQRHPKLFGLTLLCAHFCVTASKYDFAVAEYTRAHRLRPHHALTSLCAGVAYISFAMSRTVARRHDLVLKGFAFAQRYKKLRLAEGVAGTGGAEGSQRAEWQVDEVARRAEAAYNYGRMYHQLSINHLAVACYEDALDQLEALGRSSGAGFRPDLCVVRHSSAYNLACLLRAQGAVEMADQVLMRHVTF
ncbi:unnamed protein product [Prorocentrum cordatum]|uniref:General transcription factor 3C polypeptide 3 n=1 Tax=Prorocentrum cordatum TaxID=2364126 RepID=A0ABN9YG22_9DINO|nr:unnamed protein product [Polarella glacialis]